MTGHARCAALLALVLAACGAGPRPPFPAPPARAPQATVFNDLTREERTLPAAVEGARDEHTQQVRAAADTEVGADPGKRP